MMFYQRQQRREFQRYLDAHASELAQLREQLSPEEYEAVVVHRFRTRHNPVWKPLPQRLIWPVLTALTLIAVTAIGGLYLLLAKPDLPTYAITIGANLVLAGIGWFIYRLRGNDRGQTAPPPASPH